MAYNAIQHYAPFTVTAFLKSIGILANLGVVEVDPTDRITKEGDFIEIPKINDTSDFVRRNLGASSTRTFTAMGTVMEVGVVLHDDVADKYLIGQQARTGANFRPVWASRVGLKWARRAKQSLYRVAKTAVEVADTTDGSTASADIHISDQYSSTVNQTMTFSRLQDAKAKMGDRAGDLTVVVMHSTPWNNLVKDGISNYKIENVSGALLNVGGLGISDITPMMNFGIARFDALGLAIIIDDDISSISMTGSTYTYKTKYETLLLGANSLYLGYQRALTLFEDDDIKNAAGVDHLMRAEVDYCAHLRGIKWNVTTANPTDTVLGTRSNWDECYQDHKEVKCVKLITNG